MANPTRLGHVTEHSEQVALIDWCRVHEGRYPELALIYAVPNGAAFARRNNKKNSFSLQAMKIKAEGLRAGVPDLCLPVARNGMHGMYIEMKVGRNRPTPEQEQYLDALDHQGYHAVVCWGYQEARQALCDYLGIAEVEDG